MNSPKPKSSPQGRPPASSGEDRRAYILDSALSLFAAQGIAATPIAQIAKAAGVTSAMVHYYFGNREKLLDTLVAERLAPVVVYIWGSASDEGIADPIRVITAFVDRLLETVERMPQLPLLWNREIFNVGGELRARVMPFVPVDNFERLRQALAQAQQEGRLNNGIAPGLVVMSVIGLVMFPLVARNLIEKIPGVPVIDRETVRQHTLSLMLGGLFPKKETIPDTDTGS